MDARGGLEVEHMAELFDAATVEGLVQSFKVALGCVAANPGACLATYLCLGLDCDCKCYMCLSWHLTGALHTGIPGWVGGLGVKTGAAGCEGGCSGCPLAPACNLGVRGCFSVLASIRRDAALLGPREPHWPTATWCRCCDCVL